jgi:hypothetical protein
MYQPPQNPDEPTASSQQPYSQYPPQQPYYPGDNQPTYQTPPAYPPPPNQYPPLQPQRKSRTWLWVVLSVLVFLVLACAGLVALAAIGSRSTTTTTPGTVASGNTPAEGNTPAATNAPASVGKVGSTITVNDVATTLISVKKLAADQYTQPKPGNIFIVVHVKITNNSTGEVDYNEFDFHVRSGSGNITDSDVSPSTYTANNLLNSGKLSAGGSVEGDIVFQVKKGDHASELTWQPNFLGNAGDNAWSLGL